MIVQFEKMYLWIQQKRRIDFKYMLIRIQNLESKLGQKQIFLTNFKTKHDKGIIEKYFLLPVIDITKIFRRETE